MFSEDFCQALKRRLTIREKRGGGRGGGGGGGGVCESLVLDYHLIKKETSERSERSYRITEFLGDSVFLV